MKKIYAFICFLVAWNSINAQLYVRTDDASGPLPTNEEVLNLEAAAQEIVDILPNEFKSRFKVYDFGYYIHNELMQDAVPAIWAEKTGEIDNDPSSDYYIIFGRESNYQSLNRFVRVDLRLPSGQYFACLSATDKADIERSVQAAANGPDMTRVYQYEKESLEALKAYIYNAVVCNCDTTGPGCNLNADFTILDIQLRGLGFRKRAVQVGAEGTWSNGAQGIYDYAGKKLILEDGEYYIPTEISESKAIFDATTQVLPDTTINTSLTGEVYILDNASFINGEWELAVERSAELDYVEYWVILTDKVGKSFLYSRYTIGALNEVVAAKADDNNKDRSSTASSPWSMALKALGNAAVDACVQAVIIRVVESGVNDWPTAWSKVSYLGAAWEGLSSLIPWKKESALDNLTLMATKAFVVVLDNAIKKPDYTVVQGITDFIISFATDGVIQLINHPKTRQYLGNGLNIVKVSFSKGLGRIFANNATPVIVKKIIAKASYFLCNNIKREIIHTVKIVGNTNKTTTILGRFDPDMTQIIKSILPHEFNIGISFGFTGANKGGFNFLNVPNSAWSWNSVNLPWLLSAIERGDDIFLATIPKFKKDLVNNLGEPIGVLGKEIKEMVTKNYKPSNISASKWNQIKSWYK